MPWSSMMIMTSIRAEFVKKKKKKKFQPTYPNFLGHVTGNTSHTFLFGLSHSERMNPIDFGGQRSKVKFTTDMWCIEISLLLPERLTCCVLIFIELCRHVSHGKRMNSIDFGGHMSKVKVMMGIWWLTNVGCAGMLRFALLYLFLVPFCSQIFFTLESSYLAYNRSAHCTQVSDQCPLGL